VSKRTERTESVFGVQIHQKKCEVNKKTKLLVKEVRWIKTFGKFVQFNTNGVFSMTITEKKENYLSPIKMN
jgi:hypothetical protein